VKALDPFAVVKECKGAALSILVLLATNQQLGGGAVTQEWLERHSGYTDKPVSQALAYLGETGRLTHTPLGWVLTGAVPASVSAPSLTAAPGGSQSAGPAVGERQPDAAPTAEEPGGRASPSPQASLAAPPCVGAGAADRELSDSPAATAAIDPPIDSREAEAAEQGVGIIPTQVNLEHVQANLAAFKQWGVGRNEKTILLSARPGVTPRQIENIAKRLISEKRFTTGLLITAVQCDDQPVPDLPGKYAPPQAGRDPDKYAQWEE
jgi:hypothetical protein